MSIELAEPAAIETAPQAPAFRTPRLLFSFPVVLAAALVVLTVLTVRGRFSDPDMWWHLKTGEIIWNTHSIPRVDSFSFTTNHHAYVPHEWLSQLIMCGTWKAGGYTGLMLWLCVLSSLIIVAGYALCSLYSGNAKVALLGGLGIWLFSTIGLAIRPQLIGYLLLVCELLIVHLGRRRDPRWFLVLPPLFALWVNCHGSFFLGLVALAVVLGCSFLEFELGLLVSRCWDKRPRNILALAFALSLVALFVNPIGVKQVMYPLDTLLNQQVQMNEVSEWRPPDFSDIRALALFGISGLILLVPLLRRMELRLQELLFLILAFWLAFRHERMLTVFGILVMPVLCRLLATAWDQYEPQRDRLVPNAIFVAASVLAVILAFPDRFQLSEQVEKGNPVQAVEFINHSGLSGNMLNEYVYGGYLIWAAPQHKVFVDGRGDVFEWTGVLTEYGKWATLQSDPNILLDKYRINFCLLSRNAPMSQVLPFLPGWKTIYYDESSSIFARSGAITR